MMVLGISSLMFWVKQVELVHGFILNLLPGEGRQRKWKEMGGGKNGKGGVEAKGGRRSEKEGRE